MAANVCLSEICRNELCGRVRLTFFWAIFVNYSENNSKNNSPNKVSLYIPSVCLSWISIKGPPIKSAVTKVPE